VASSRDGVKVWDASTWKKDALTEVAPLPSQARTDLKESQAALARVREQMQRTAALAESEPAEPQLVWRVRQLAAELDGAQEDRQRLA
jgi:O-succinylbenzoate synthase